MVDSTFPTTRTLQCLQTRNAFGETLDSVAGERTTSPSERSAADLQNFWRVENEKAFPYIDLLNPRQSMRSGFHYEPDK